MLLLTHVAAKREFGRVVAEETSNESISGVTGNHASVGAIVKVRVDCHALIESCSGAVTNILHAQGAINVVVNLAEQGHVHRPCVASNVEVITGTGRVSLNPVVAAIETSGGTYKSRLAIGFFSM